MNENTPTYRERGRAVFLAAIMVLSMVAGVATLGVAPAAAVNADGVAGIDGLDAPGVTGGQDETTQNVTIENVELNGSDDDILSLNVSDSLGAGIEINLTDSSASIKNTTTNVNASVNVSDSDGSGIISDQTNGTISIDVNNTDSSNNNTADVFVDLTLDTPNSEELGLEYEVTDGNGNFLVTDSFDNVVATDVSAQDIDVTAGDDEIVINITNSSSADEVPFALNSELDDDDRNLVDANETVGGVDVNTGTNFTEYTVNLTEVNGGLPIGDYDVFAAAENSSDPFGEVNSSNFQVNDSVTVDGLEVDSGGSISDEIPRVAANNTQVSVTFNVTNTGSADVNQSVAVIAENVTNDIGSLNLTDPNETVASQFVEVANGTTEQVTLEFNTGELPVSGDPSNITDFEIALFSEASPFSASEVVELKTGSNSGGTIGINVRDQTNDPVEGETVELFLESEFGSGADPIAVATTDANGDVLFTDLAVGETNNDTIRYVAQAGVSADFTSTATELNLFEPTQTSASSQVTIQRIINADDIAVDPDPAQVDIEDNVSTTVTVTTNDESGSGSDPLDSTPVEIINITSNAGSVDNVAETDLSVSEGVERVTDLDGEVNFDLFLDLTDPDLVTEEVNFDITYRATSFGDSDETNVTETQEVTFVPEIRGTGTLSGEVDELTQDAQLGVDSSDSPSIQPVEGLGVHAVPLSDVAENTVELNTSNTTVTSVDRNDRYRVVEFDGGAVSDTLDARSDYLVTSSDGEVVQNQTSLGFDVDESGNISIHFLETGNFTIQAFNSTSAAFENETVLRPDGTELNGQFEATENLTYDGIDQEFANDPVSFVDITNSQGGFELFNLPADTYVVVAGELSAPAPDTSEDLRYGFANFAGFDIVDVSPNVDAESEQLNTDLTVQQFEVDEFFDFDLDVVLENESGELVKSERIQTGEEIEAIINVTATSQDTGENAPGVADGQRINLSLVGDTTAGNLNATSVTVDGEFADGQRFANVTFQADDLQGGTVNISASVTNNNEQTFNTSAGGQGLNDRSDQAEIEVFKTVEITGDVVNGEDENIPGANVTLTNLDTGEDVANTSTGETGSYVFTNIETGFNYSAEAVALDSNGDEVSNERELNGGDPVETALGGEDIVVADADPNNPLNPPAGTGSPVDGISNEQFNAVLTNGADTTLVELRGSVGEWSSDPFGEINNVELTLSELRDVVDFWAAQQ